ncbi:hypothetical protein GWN26_16385, partial [Candidatus Saccharibacteria bacterium]|nr:hypothetical protein [Candidatus Saccharibacteria bacterium]NIV73251.1 hypothetical protein [Calditrichia bacterium]NIW00612.1 hypothetical protein [Candidatus Saccharibacteria bacterium]
IVQIQQAQFIKAGEPETNPTTKGEIVKKLQGLIIIRLSALVFLAKVNTQRINGAEFQRAPQSILGDVIGETLPVIIFQRQYKFAAHLVTR